MKIMQIFRISNIYFKNIFFVTILIIIFCELFIKFRTFFFYLKPFTGNFWNIAHPCKLYASKYWKCDYSLILSKFVIYLLFAFEYLCVAWHIPPLIPFSTSLAYHYLLIILIYVFFKQACHANPGADKKWTGSSCYISIHLFVKLSNTSASNDVSL